MPEARVAVIGGTGLYQLDALRNIKQVDLTTPFGPPSDTITLGTLEDVGVAFLPRHGRGHSISPTEIPAKANIYALKSLGVERIISVSAVGSLREKIKPLDIVVPDQLIDRTRSRVNSFFGDGIVAHVAFADPFCPVLSQILLRAAQKVGGTAHEGGTCVVMEGPLFSTRAESHLYRSWGASIIGMTALPEAKLAREAEICYATLAFATDYDCWHEVEESVSVEMVASNLMKNVAVSRSILERAISMILLERDCLCSSALNDAIITAPEYMPEDTKKDLELIIGKYI